MQPDERRALGLLAYLPRMTGELAAALTGQIGMPEFLERLAATSLFTQRREGSDAAYEFHALFAEFLRQRHERTAPAGELRDLRVHAGRLLLAVGEVDAGLRHLLDAEAWDEAAAQLRLHAAAYVADGRFIALGQAIAALPPAVADQLAYWRGFACLDTNPAATLADMAIACESSDPHEQLAAAALAATALVSKGRFVELDRWIDLVDRVTAFGPALDTLDAATEAQVVPGLLAALVYGRPWHPLTQSLAERGEGLLHAEAPVGQQLLLGALVFHLLWRGETDRLRRVMLRIDDLCRGAVAPAAALMRWWSIGILVKAMCGDTDSAREDLRRALALLDAEPSIASQRCATELLGTMVGVASGDAAAARGHLDRAARALHPDSAADRANYEIQSGLVALLVDDRFTALRLARSAVATGRRSGYAAREHIALITHALAATLCDEHGEATRLLDEARAHPMWAVCRWRQWIGGCVAAYAALRRGDDDCAAGEVALAFHLAREHGFRFALMPCSVADLMPRLCALALARGIEVEVARDLVRRLRLKAPAQADANWPWPVRVWVLGGFEVEVGGAPLPHARKESRRLLELLRLLAAHGSAGVSIDHVADALWPDADGDAAHNALDNALHRLRRLLGGDDRILLRRSALALNGQRCWVDLQALLGRLALLEACADIALPAALRAAGELYRGPLLPQDDTGIVTARRAALRLQVRRAHQAAIGRLVANGLHDLARDVAPMVEGVD